MSGDLAIFSMATDIFLTLVDDIRTSFLRLLTTEKLLDQFFEEHGRVGDVATLLYALDQYLHGNTALYFQARYVEAVPRLNELVEETAAAVGNLDAPQLLKLSRAKSVVSRATRTSQMRSHLARIDRYVPTGESDKIRRLIRAVEESISKDTAAKRLHEAESIPTSGHD